MLVELRASNWRVNSLGATLILIFGYVYSYSLILIEMLRNLYLVSSFLSIVNETKFYGRVKDEQWATFEG